MINDYKDCLHKSFVICALTFSMFCGRFCKFTLSFSNKYQWLVLKARHIIRSALMHLNWNLIF